MIMYRHGLKDSSVWINGLDVNEKDLLEQSIDMRCANKAIERYKNNELISDIGKFGFRASLIFLYKEELDMAKWNKDIFGVYYENS